MPREDWAVFENTQEAIIDKETFAIVQKMRESRRRPRMPNKKENIFAGLLFCADCENRMYFHRRGQVETNEGFVCASYKKHKHCRSHHISLTAITEVILNDLHKVCNAVREREQEFVQMYRDDCARKSNRLQGTSKSELQRIENRCTEIDEIIRKLYEDNVRGRITDERFDILAKGYETEKAELKEKAQQFQSVLHTVAKDDENLENFIRLVKRYTEIPELNREILNAFIDKVYIGETVKTQISTKRHRRKYLRTRTIRIIYKFIGAVNLD